MCVAPPETPGEVAGILFDMNLRWGIEGTLPVAVSHSRVTSLFQYRLVPIPRARYDFACASLVFVCILLVHLLVMPRSACDGEDGQILWGYRGGDYGRTQQKLARRFVASREGPMTMGPSPLEQGDGPRVGVSGSSLQLGMKLSQVPLSPAKSCYLGGSGLSLWKQWPLSFPFFRWGSETYKR